LALAEQLVRRVDLTSPGFMFDAEVARRQRIDAFENLDRDSYRQAILQTR
jgi:hypothetical protein